MQAPSSASPSLPASIVLAERSAPRYTSYPTAPHFSADVNAVTGAGWLDALPADSTLSLYLHVPFCTAICNYCGCHTKAVRRAEPIDSYTATLEDEIALLSRATVARRVTHIHWGGGTPSLLGPNRLERLAAALQSGFDLSGIVEHAIELDPRTVTAKLADGLRRIGINRVSLGVQDFNDHVQRAIGRVQPVEIVERAVAHLRNVGMEAINIDLMYGLPTQSVDDVWRTTLRAAALNPSRLAIFGYAHVPWMKKHQRLIDAAALPGALERLAQAEAARQALIERGYEPIGLDHFARPDDPLANAARNGTMRRNFQGYTTDAAHALLPLGASSIGQLPQGYVQNAPDIGAWSRAIREGRLPIVRGVAISADDRLRAAVIERLMCDFEVDYGALARASGDETLLDDAAPHLDNLAHDGVIRRYGRKVTSTQAGRPFVRLAAAAFDAYLHKGVARHSVAV